MSSHYESAAQALKDKVRLVQDFPEEGILFEDLTPVLADPEAFRTVVDGLAAACEELGAEMIGGLDARGFLLGAGVALGGLAGGLLDLLLDGLVALGDGAAALVGLDGLHEEGLAHAARARDAELRGERLQLGELETGQSGALRGGGFRSLFGGGGFCHEGSF